MRRFFAILLLLSCTEAGVEPVLVPSTPLDPLPPDHPELALRVASRGPRRLSVRELARTWEVVLGLPRGVVEIPENLARSLGEPDYLSTTEPDLEPSPLFMKFMVDLSVILCRNALEAEPRRPVAERIFYRSSSDDENLRSLLLRFFALESSPEMLSRLRLAFDRAGGGDAGYLAACVALGTAPEFLLY